jgi:flagellar protein FliS
MSYGNTSAQYLEADILSRSKEWLVPLLYEHLLARLRRAGVQIEAGDFEGKAESIGKANEIVLELAGNLDLVNGGELAKQLSSLYAFFAGEILAISRTLELERLERLVALIADLHEAWVQAAEQVAPRGRATGARPVIAL